MREERRGEKNTSLWGRWLKPSRDYVCMYEVRSRFVNGGKKEGETWRGKREGHRGKRDFVEEMSICQKRLVCLGQISSFSRSISKRRI